MTNKAEYKRRLCGMLAQELEPSSPIILAMEPDRMSDADEQRFHDALIELLAEMERRAWPKRYCKRGTP